MQLLVQCKGVFCKRDTSYWPYLWPFLFFFAFIRKILKNINIKDENVAKTKKKYLAGRTGAGCFTEEDRRVRSFHQ